VQELDAETHALSKNKKGSCDKGLSAQIEGGEMFNSFKTMHSVHKSSLAVLLGFSLLLGAHHSEVNAQTRYHVPSSIAAERAIDLAGIDTDGDGVIDQEDYDDDNDGVADIDDAFPLDSSEWLDTDLDGIGDSSDATPFGDGEQIANEQEATLRSTIAARGFAKSVRADAEYQIAIDALVDQANAIVARSAKSTSRTNAAKIAIEPIP